MTTTETIIYVDADACPVKEEIIRVAERHNVRVIMVADGGLRPSRHDLVRTHIVSQGADAADDWIADQIQQPDICITSDIPLAGRCLEKGAAAIRPNGKEFDETNIGMALAMRDLSRHLREESGKQTFNAAFTKADRSAFLETLHKLLLARKGRSP